MYEPNQIELPPAFMALYSENGRPTAGRATVEARYDLCEDMAQQMTDFCANLQFRNDLSQDEVLRRCLAALTATPDGVVTEAEAQWVVARTAELLNWPRPSPGT